MNANQVIEHTRKVLAAAERLNKYNVECAQVAADLHGDRLYRDYMGKMKAELDEAFQGYYACFQPQTENT